MEDLHIVLRNGLRDSLRNLDAPDADLRTIANATKQTAEIVIAELDIAAQVNAGEEPTGAAA